MPSEPPPQTLEDYKQWFVATHAYDDVRDRRDYDFSATRIRDTLHRHPFWTELGARLIEYEAEYDLETGYPLFAGGLGSVSPIAPEVALKPFESLLNKTWRRNALENTRWPRPPVGGWITPDNWYGRIGDIVRTTFVVKYLDGVIRLQGGLREHAMGSNLRCKTELAARHEGHYAAHLDVGFAVELPMRPWGTRHITAHAEIQITTQLQDVITRLLHRQYEDARIHQPSGNWEWDYAGEAFHVNYLGHVLHYLEGMIMDERERGTNGGV